MVIANDLGGPLTNQQVVEEVAWHLAAQWVPTPLLLMHLEALILEQCPELKEEPAPK
jgi:hypothetical protein